MTIQGIDARLNNLRRTANCDECIASIGTPFAPGSHCGFINEGIGKKCRMPWKESRVVDKRIQFIAEVLDGEESMSAICEAFEISRKTGYKCWMRYLQAGSGVDYPTHRRCSAMIGEAEWSI